MHWFASFRSVRKYLILRCAGKIIVLALGTSKFLAIYSLHVVRMDHLPFIPEHDLQ